MYYLLFYAQSIFLSKVYEERVPPSEPSETNYPKTEPYQSAYSWADDSDTDESEKTILPETL